MIGGSMRHIGEYNYTTKDVLGMILLAISLLVNIVISLLQRRLS